MITISSPKIIEFDEKIRLQSTIYCNMETQKKWVKFFAKLDNFQKEYPEVYTYNDEYVDVFYEVDKKYQDYLCYENCDAFVIALLYYAVAVEEDIKCEGFISGELYNNLNQYFLPTLCRNSNKNRIRVLGKIKDFNFRPTEVVTSCSGGVDSFFSIVDNIENKFNSKYNITYLALCNAGAYHYFPYYITKKKTFEEWDNFAYEEFIRKCKKGEQIAKGFELNFISINTNLTKIYQGLFGYINSYCNLSCYMALQKLFKVAYYSTAGDNLLVTNNIFTCSEDYDEITTNYISNGNIRFYSSGVGVNRIEKTLAIADNEVVKQYLNVCEFDYNCGVCTKCKRTLADLMVLGKLDNFVKVFPNIEDYKTKRSRYLARIIFLSKFDGFSKDTYQYIKQNNIKIPFKSKLIAAIATIRWKILKIFR